MTSLNIYQDVLVSNSEQFYREITLGSGTYRVVATAHMLNSPSTGETVEIVSGHGHLNMVLVGLSILALVVGAIATGIFFTVLPFTVLVLIINAASKPSRPAPVYSGDRSSTPRPTEPTSEYQRQQVQTQNQIKTKSSPFSFDPESFAAKLTTKDWAWLMIALICFIGFIFDPNSPLLAVAIIIAAAIIYSVSEREKTKVRILNLLNNYPFTSVEFLEMQLGKKRKYVIKVLQFMILDDAMPITLDMGTLDVKVVGPLKPYLVQKEYVPTAARVETPEQSTEQEIETVAETASVQIIADPPAEITMHCTACGEGLIGKPKYCYICGQKTI
ncbi:MAG: hypothetical protein ACW99Q_12195 [Candidatus Kariarchaeaceae archaeon]|jgi:hypothetical protein